MLELKQLVSAFIGAALALMGQWVVARARRAATARSLSIALWEELSAVQFGAHAADKSGKPMAYRVGGFSSQTFDSLFRELATSLPDGLARDLMRYHWRLKFLVMQQEKSKYKFLDYFLDFYREGETLHADLLLRLQRYGDHSIARLMLRSGE